MRIVYFLPDIEAGVSRIVRNLLKYKPKSDVEYIVVLMRHKEGRCKNFTAEFFNATKTIIFEYNSLDNVYVIYKRMAALLDPSDIIVGNDGYEIRMVTALKLKNPLVYIVHGDFDYYYLICKLNQSVINLFIAYSEKIYLQLKHDLLEENKKKIELIYYPSAALDYKIINVIKANRFTIVFAGTLDERKGAHLLWNIYAKLIKWIPNLALEIIGDGEFKQKLIEQFRDASNVTISGWQSNEYVLRRFSESHIFLFPSFLEGLPNVLVEALSRGAVPVASDLSSGVTDILQNNKNGLLVEVGNAEAFVTAIIFLYNNPERLKSMSKFGKETLIKFEPRMQAKLYHDKIVHLANESAQYPERAFPKYPMGGWLNKPWIPNTYVKLLRRFIKHPKL